MSYILKTNNLSKTFNGKAAVADVNMQIKKGEIYGFLGPNGAGKTTIMRMAANLVKPTSGEIELFGEKLTDTSYEVLKRMGAIIEYPAFYEKLTGRENLELHCEYMGYHNKKAIREALETVGLTDIESKKVKELSLGMKQRLAIARAIITKPELLILDEPINGLDPIGINQFRSLFKLLSKEYGMTLFISSHILKEIEQIADTIGVINNGRLMDEIPMEQIRQRVSDYIELKTNNCQKAAYILSHELGIQNFKIIDDAHIRIYEAEAVQSNISKVLIMNDVAIEGIHKQSASLEDYFLKMMNGGVVHA